MDLQLTDRVAFVAGSSKGIGRAIATELLREGCRVCLSGRNSDALEEACRELRTKFGDKVLGIPGDMTDRSVIDAALGAIYQKWGGLEIVVANLGSGKGKPGWNQEQDEWERLFNVNFFGSVRLAQAAIPYLQAHGGNILFIASIVAVESTPAPLPYSAAKAALVNYSKNLSRAVANSGIHVNCIAPGNILFPGVHGNGISKNAVKKWRNISPRKFPSSASARLKTSLVLRRSWFLPSPDFQPVLAISPTAARHAGSDWTGVTLDD